MNFTFPTSSSSDREGTREGPHIGAAASQVHNRAAQPDAVTARAGVHTSRWDSSSVRSRTKTSGLRGMDAPLAA